MELPTAIATMTNNKEERKSVIEGSNDEPIQFKMETLHNIASSLQENLQNCVSKSFKELEEENDHNSLSSRLSVENDAEESKNEMIGSLCRNIAPSIRELSANLNKLQIWTQSGDTQLNTPSKQTRNRSNAISEIEERNRNLQHMIAECRKTLLDSSTAITAAGVASKGKRMTSMKVLSNSAFPLLQSGATQALKISEYISNHEMIYKTAAPVLEMLDILERSAAVASRNVFLNLKLFGMRLATFLELIVIRMRDLRNRVSKMNITSQTDTLRKLLPVIIQNLPSTTPSSSNSKELSVFTGTSRQLFFNLARTSINKIIDHFQYNEAQFENPSFSSINSLGFVEPGSFIKKIDEILEQLNNHKLKMDRALFTEVQSSADYIIQFALSISKLSKQNKDNNNINDDNNDIMNACRNVISEMESLKISLTKGEDQNCYNEVKLGREVVGDFIEILEQTVNSTLLSMIIKVYTSAHLPLDKLIVGVSLDNDDENINNLVNNFDENTDAIFQIAHLSTLCCTDKKRSQSINSSLHFMEALEKEIVPATLRIRPSSNSDGVEERNHLKCLRQLWKDEVDSLEESLMDIVDPTAYCLVAERELVACAKSIHDSAYTQDSEFLRSQLMKLTKISKYIVDFSWKIERNTSKDLAKIEDNNPVVQAERSIWEVEAASVQTLKSIDDLNLHKSMLKRIQVMVTSINCLIKYLMNEESKKSSSSSDDSMPVSMIKILKNESTITRTASLNKHENLHRHNKSTNLSKDNDSVQMSRQNNSKGQKSPVKVLTSISRIIIGEDCSTSIVYDNKATNESEVLVTASQNRSQLIQPKKKSRFEMNSQNKSFRNIALKSALKNRDNQPRRCVNPVTFDIADQTIERLSQSVGQLMPFSTRAGQESCSTTTNTIYYTPKASVTNNSISNSKNLPLSVPNEFDLSQILNKLTQLSHELSVSLQQADDLKLEDEPLVNKDTSEIIIKETKELKSINDSIASASRSSNKNGTANKIILAEENTGQENVVDRDSISKKKTSTSNAIIENDLGCSPLLNTHRKPLKSIGNGKENKKLNQSPFRNKSDKGFKTNNKSIYNPEEIDVTKESTRAMEVINQYRLENNTNLSTPERKRDLELMEMRISALLKTSS